jgi:hypothetical protein
MKGFYDKIVPSVAKDVMKKLGGGKIETISIGGDRFKVGNDPENGWFYEDNAGGGESGFHTEREAREAAAADNSRRGPDI